MMSTTMGWFERIKMYIGWDLADRARIARLRRCIAPGMDAMVEELGQQLTKFKGAQGLMSNTRFVHRLQALLYEWLNGLLDGAFDQEYVHRRSAFGEKLLELDMSFEDVLILEELTRQQFLSVAKTELQERPQALSSLIHTLDKAFNLDLAMIYTTYLELRDARMERALLDRFLTVTGFSRTLYENLAEAREWSPERQPQRHTKLS